MSEFRNIFVDTPNRFNYTRANSPILAAYFRSLLMQSLLMLSEEVADESRADVLALSLFQEPSSTCPDPFPHKASTFDPRLTAFQ